MFGQRMVFWLNEYTIKHTFPVTERERSSRISDLVNASNVHVLENPVREMERKNKKRDQRWLQDSLMSAPD